MNRTLVFAICCALLGAAVLAFAQADAPKKLLEYVDTATTELKATQQKILNKLKLEDTALEVKVVRLVDAAFDGPNLEIRREMHGDERPEDGRERRHDPIHRAFFVARTGRSPARAEYDGSRRQWHRRFRLQQVVVQYPPDR